MPQITVTLTGSFSDRGAKIDDCRLTLSGIAGGPQSATQAVTVGDHLLEWSVNGAPGASYSVALGGDTQPWEKSFTINGDGGDDGFKNFSAK